MNQSENNTVDCLRNTLKKYSKNVLRFSWWQ